MMLANWPVGHGSQVLRSLKDWCVPRAQARHSREPGEAPEAVPGPQIIQLVLPGAG